MAGGNRRHEPSGPAPRAKARKPRPKPRAKARFEARIDTELDDLIIEAAPRLNVTKITLFLTRSARLP